MAMSNTRPNRFLIHCRFYETFGVSADNSFVESWSSADTLSLLSAFQKAKQWLDNRPEKSIRHACKIISALLKEQRRIARLTAAYAKETHETSQETTKHI